MRPKSSNAQARGELLCSSGKSGVIPAERKGQATLGEIESTGKQELIVLPQGGSFSGVAPVG